MAVKSPLMPSPTALTSAFFPYTDLPSSPIPFQSITNPQPQRLSGHSDTLHPPPSPYPQFVDPSPVDSNGTESTETTDIDDDVEDLAQEQTPKSPELETASPNSPESLLGKIDTSLAARTRGDSETETGPQSVIHAPQDFKQFDAQNLSPKSNHMPPSPTDKSETTVVSPHSPEAVLTPDARRESRTSALNTDVPPTETVDRPTPKAQTRQDLDDEWKRRSRHNLSLEGIPEGQDVDRGAEEELENDSPGVDTTTRVRDERLHQVSALKTALRECWTLCNTLAGLSSNHRTRIFNYRSQGPVQGEAWRSCWRLCQNLYESRDEEHSRHVAPTLEMCRDLCQALFEARQKGEDVADSVLRTSFELNNHFYNTLDRNLPAAYQERTLDFYVTLCHRLIKHRTSLPEETDALLRAGWGLANMLFSIRQSSRDGKPDDEELLGSAVQACWDLCDLFREEWTQIRPERSTPRPHQTAFPRSQSSFRSHPTYSDHSSPSITRSASAHSYHDNPVTFPPETPTTIFDDMNESVDNDDPNVPNILVLGPEQSSSSSHHNRWSSSASTLSGYSDSQRSSSTTTANAAEAHLSRIRVLLVKAATNAGFQLHNSPPSSIGTSSTTAQHQNLHQQQQNQNLLAFVKAIPLNSFGSQPWQMTLLDKYRKLVAAWPVLLRNVGGSGGPLLVTAPRRTTAVEIAGAVQWILRNEQYVWFRDLFRVVFGCFPDDSVALMGVVIQA